VEGGSPAPSAISVDLLSLPFPRRCGPEEGLGNFRSIGGVASGLGWVLLGWVSVSETHLNSRPCTRSHNKSF